MFAVIVNYEEEWQLELYFFFILKHFDAFNSRSVFLAYIV
jgi:hypothetical protein